MSDYALHSLAPAQVVAPTSAEELAACLAEAAAAGRAVVPWGGGTRQHLGRAPARYDLALVTGGLGRVLEYHPDDLVVTVEAGVTLGAVQAELARHGQWLPWDPPLSARASIGGLLASGAAGALRLGYGAPRDWLLGMRVALGDGRLVRSGGRVVKNVAGYDSHKLHIGALGTLGVIVEATFKVQPLPAMRRTLLASFSDAYLPEQAIAALRARPLEPIAIVALNLPAAAGMPALATFLEGQTNHIMIAAHYAGAEAAVTRQVWAAAQRCIEAGARTVELSEADDAPLWEAIADLAAPGGDGSTFIRAAIANGEITPVASLMENIGLKRGWRPAQLAIGGPGLVYSRWSHADATRAELAAALAELRAGLAPHGGYAVLEEAPLAGLDVWGPEPEGAAIMRALRASWDPGAILNPGRYLI